MELTSVSSFQYLHWDTNRKRFEILDSTDRKIISFLLRSVKPSCSFYRKEFLSHYEWSKKGFADFKPRFLRGIEQEFQMHIDKCPVAEYRQPLAAFSKTLQQQISDLTLDSTVPKETALLSLQKVCTDCFRKIFQAAPLNIPQSPFTDLQEKNQQYLNALSVGQCYHYAFYLTGEYDVMLSMIPFASTCNVAFLLYPQIFLKYLGYTATPTPVKGDLVLYLGDPKLDNNSRFKHLGVMTERGTIKSSWNIFSCQFEHQVFQVPDIYGSEVIFLHKTPNHPPDFDRIIQMTNQMSRLILPFNSQYIPSPFTNFGALLYLLDQLRSDCKMANLASEEWDWDKMKESLLAAIPNHSHLTHDELRKEFQLSMQEALPQQFV